MKRECQVVIGCTGNACMTVVNADGKLIHACVKCAGVFVADLRTVESASEWELSW